MLKISIFGKSVSAVLPIFIFAVTGLSPVSAYASTSGLSDASNHVAILGRPYHMPPINPPIDTPAFHYVLVNIPAMKPADIPANTLPDAGFGQASVPAPAALWLFGSCLLGLAGIVRHKKPA